MHALRTFSFHQITFASFFSHTYSTLYIGYKQLHTIQKYSINTYVQWEIYTRKKVVCPTCAFHLQLSNSLSVHIFRRNTTKAREIFRRLGGSQEFNFRGAVPSRPTPCISKIKKTCSFTLSLSSHHFPARWKQKSARAAGEKLAHTDLSLWRGGCNRRT